MHRAHHSDQDDPPTIELSQAHSSQICPSFNVKKPDHDRCAWQCNNLIITAQQATLQFLTFNSIAIHLMLLTLLDTIKIVSRKAKVIGPVY